MMTSISGIFASCKMQEANTKPERQVIVNKGIRVRWLAQLSLGLSLLGAGFPVYSQHTGAHVEWIKQAGSLKGSQSGAYTGLYAITTDAADNSYIVGRFHEAAIFGATTLTNNVKFTETFIAKLDPAGNFIWAKQQPLGDGTTVPGHVSGQTAYVTGIAADAEGNCYITGTFRSVITLGPIKLKSSKGGANIDMFIAKMDNNGDFLWAKQIIGTSVNSAVSAIPSIAVDSTGNCYVTGKLHDETFTFGSTTLTGTWAGMPFITKLDPAGNFIWVNKIEGGDSPHIKIEGIGVDNSGNSYIAGVEHVGASFGSFTIAYNTTGSIFIAKLDATGKFQWVKEAGLTSDGFDALQEIAVDVSGNCYITGALRKTGIFGSITLKTNNSNTYDVSNFIAKLDATGDFLWAKQIEGSSLAIIGISGIAADASGNSYVTGTYSGQKMLGPPGFIVGETVFFGPDTLTTTESVSTFIAKLDAGGNFLWAKDVDSSGTRRIATNASGSCYLAGMFYGDAITFDSNTLTSDNGDIFICKISGQEQDQGVGMAGHYSDGSIIPMPNPFHQHIHLQIDLQETAGADISVYDLTGRQVYDLENQQLPKGKSTIVLSPAFENAPPGLYMVNVSLDNGAKWVRKVVKVVN